MPVITKHVQRLAGAMRGWLFVLWIYLSAGWRHVGWRRRMRRRIREGWRGQQRHIRQATIEESIDTGMKQTLLFIRHGQSTWNEEHRLPGQVPGILLTDAGRQQAARLADALSVLPVSAIISSPLERASDTAEILAQTFHLPVCLEPALMDTAMGDFAGKDYNEIRKSNEAWKAFVRDPTHAPPGVESFPQVQERAVAAVERWRAREGIGAYPAFVTHADVVKLLLAHYTGLEPGRAGSLFIDNASVSIVEMEGDQRPRIVAISWSPRPGWLTPPTAPKQPVSEDTQPSGTERSEKEQTA
jgi:broad specificity phosphatase PhoE